MRYPGGKGKIFQHVINLLPPHATYVESHLGGGAVLRNKKPSPTSVAIDLDPRVINYWKKSFPDLATYVEADASEFLATYPFRDDDVLYCDPPYLPRTRRQARVYRFDYRDDDHERLLRVLLLLPCRVLISGYPSEMYEQYLSEWNTHSFHAKAHDGIRLERVWFNYQPPIRLHDSRFLGSDFRERENIRRRLGRIKRRIHKLSLQEQWLIADWLSDGLVGR